jgi:hypothetical protein
MDEMKFSGLRSLMNLVDCLQLLETTISQTGDAELLELIRNFLDGDLLESLDYFEQACNLAKERDYRNARINLHNVAVALVHFGELTGLETRRLLLMVELDNSKIH